VQNNIQVVVVASHGQPGQKITSRLWENVWSRKFNRPYSQMSDFQSTTVQWCA